MDTGDIFPDFFKRFQSDTFKVLEYQSYPMELICSELKIKYPEVSVFFNMVNIGNLQQKRLTDFDCFHTEKVQNAKFDLVYYVTAYDNGIEISCHYYRDRFKPVTIKKLMELYRDILKAISGDPNKKITDYFSGGGKKKKKLKRSGNR